MNKVNQEGVKFYIGVEDYLQQGDIFRVDVVSPIADIQKRIFRTSDGCHGSVYFEGNAQAKIFSEEDLISHLKTVQRGPYHVAPFCQTDDGSHELVIVEAKKIKHFVIASQTCDVSGKDKPQLPLATLLPIITLYEVCRSEKLPFSDTETISIHDFVSTNYQGAHELDLCNEYNYGGKIREILAFWLGGKLSKPLKTKVSRIKHFLSSFGNSGFMYYLGEDQEMQIPASYIDFSVICTVPTTKLETLKNNRLCRLSDRYNMDFIQKFANFFQRVALPESMRKPI